MGYPKDKEMANNIKNISEFTPELTRFLRKFSGVLPTGQQEVKNDKEQKQQAKHAAQTAKVAISSNVSQKIEMQRAQERWAKLYMKFPGITKTLISLKEISSNTNMTIGRIKSVWGIQFNKLFGQVTEAFAPIIETTNALLSWLKGIGGSIYHWIKNTLFKQKEPWDDLSSGISSVDKTTETAGKNIVKAIRESSAKTIKEEKKKKNKMELPDKSRYSLWKKFIDYTGWGMTQKQKDESSVYVPFSKRLSGIFRSLTHRSQLRDERGRFTSEKGKSPWDKLTDGILGFFQGGIMTLIGKLALVFLAGKMMWKQIPEEWKEQLSEFFNIAKKAFIKILPQDWQDAINKEKILPLIVKTVTKSITNLFKEFASLWWQTFSDRETGTLGKLFMLIGTMFIPILGKPLRFLATQIFKFAKNLVSGDLPAMIMKYAGLAGVAGASGAGSTGAGVAGAAAAAVATAATGKKRKKGKTPVTTPVTQKQSLGDMFKLGAKNRLKSGIKGGGLVSVLGIGYSMLSGKSIGEAIIDNILPVAGSILGGAIGGLGGAIVGGLVGAYVTDWLQDKSKDTWLHRFLRNSPIGFNKSKANSEIEKKLEDTLEDSLDEFSAEAEKKRFDRLWKHLTWQSMPTPAVELPTTPSPNIPSPTDIPKSLTGELIDTNALDTALDYLKKNPLTPASQRKRQDDRNKSLMPTDIRNKIIEISKKSGLSTEETAHMLALIQSESGGRNITSPTGAKGYSQLTSGVMKDFNVTDPFNADQNIETAIKYWKKNKAQLRGTLQREPTPFEIMLAHNQGARGASQIIKAYESGDKSFVDPDIQRNINAQGGLLSGLTGGQYYNAYSKYLNRNSLSVNGLTLDELRTSPINNAQRITEIENKFRAAQNRNEWQATKEESKSNIAVNNVNTSNVNSAQNGGNQGGWYNPDLSTKFGWPMAMLLVDVS